MTEVHFVIPTGYQGSFSLVVDSTNGVEVKPENKSYTYVIPKEAILKIAEEPPVFKKVKIFARFEDGTKIPMSYSFNMYPDETLAIFGPYEEEKGVDQKYNFLVAKVGDVKATMGYKKK